MSSVLTKAMKSYYDRKETASEVELLVNAHKLFLTMYQTLYTYDNNVSKENVRKNIEELEELLSNMERELSI